MFQVDILTAYLGCGVASLMGAAILRIAEADDPRLRQALRVFGWGLMTLGAGLLPAGLGPAAGHPASQFAMTWGSLAALVLMSHGLGQMQGRGLPGRWPGVLVVASAGLVAVLQEQGAIELGRGYAAALAAVSTLLAWSGSGFIVSRRLIERAIGLTLLVVAVTSWLRLGFTLAYAGPPRVDLMLLPPLPASVLAALYGVLPITLATLLLSLVNARLHQQLHSRASTDELTAVLTRRALRELAPALLERERPHGDVALLMIDLDHFKTVNDAHGHATGDAVLRAAAATLKAQLRPDALLARYGGEEFVAVIPRVDLPAARRVSERLRASIEEMPWSRVASLDRRITVSIGVALAGRHEDLDRVLQRADEALYRAKREGRNQIQVSLLAA